MGGDSYRPGYDRGPPGVDGYRPPPHVYQTRSRPDHYHPPPPLPPPPDHDRPPPPPPAYEFGSSNSGPPPYGFTPGEVSRAHPRGIRFDDSRLRGSDNAPDYDTASRRHDKRQRPDRRDQLRDRNGGRQGQGRRDWRPRQRPGASERQLLQHSARGNTPPQLEGMNGGKAAVKYVELVSDDESEDMELSEEDKPEEPSNPKWSNPETYTALPPPDESQRKRKDMVELIRKSRIEAEKEKKEADAANAVTTNDDFISLDFGDEDETLIQPPPNAPKGPAADRPTEIFIKGRAQDKVTQEEEISTTTGRTAQTSDSVEARLSGLKRKREDDEEDLEALRLAPPSKSLKKGPQPTGKITGEWIFRGTPDQKHLAIPWVTQPPNHLVKGKARLHQEIMDFHAFVSPKEYEQRVREDLLERLNQVMQSLFPRCQVRNFGSFAAGLYLPDADMDVVMLSHDFMTRGIKKIGLSRSSFYRVADRLRNSRLAEPDIEVIANAKVPIIKFVDRHTSLKVDMSFENDTGIIANSTFQQWKAQFPAMPIIVMIVKQFLSMRGLNDVAVGGIGGFTVTCLVTSLLQMMPRVQTRELDPSSNLGEILLEFLDYYGNHFNYHNVAIRMEPPGLLRKDHLIKSGQILKADVTRLMIIDPNRETNDISGGSRHIRLIADKFSEARRQLMEAMQAHREPGSNTRSLLAWMLGGNYDSFRWYRRELRRAHEEMRRPVTDRHR